MRWVIRIIGLANGNECDFANQFIEEYDFDEGECGSGLFTHDPKAAKKFDSKTDAFNFLRTQSRSHPLRKDGMPNRPLTGAHVLVEPEDGESSGL